MKRISTLLLAAGLAALAACGGGAQENVAANDVAEDELYNVVPDDLGTEDPLLNDVGNNGGNEAGDDNGLDNSAGNDADSQ